MSRCRLPFWALLGGSWALGHVLHPTSVGHGQGWAQTSPTLSCSRINGHGCSCNMLVTGRGLFSSARKSGLTLTVLLEPAGEYIGEGGCVLPPSPAGEPCTSCTPSSNTAGGQHCACAVWNVCRQEIIALVVSTLPEEGVEELIHVWHWKWSWKTKYCPNEAVTKMGCLVLIKSLWRCEKWLLYVRIRSGKGWSEGRTCRSVQSLPTGRYPKRESKIKAGLLFVVTYLSSNNW